MLDAGGELSLKMGPADHWMTIVILEHEKFLRMRESFHAQRTKLAFSHIPSRRMYLSSHVFRDTDNAMRCIPHEFGHFVTRSRHEGNVLRIRRDIGSNHPRLGWHSDFDIVKDVPTKLRARHHSKRPLREVKL